MKHFPTQHGKTAKCLIYRDIEAQGKCIGKTLTILTVLTAPQGAPLDPHAPDLVPMPGFRGRAARVVRGYLFALWGVAA